MGWVTAYQNDRLLIAYLKLMGGVLTSAFAGNPRAWYTLGKACPYDAALPQQNT